MRILVIGAGGVGSAVAAIARHRSFFERLVLTDLDGARAQGALDRIGRPDRMEARALDAGDVAAALRAGGAREWQVELVAPLLADAARPVA